MSALQSGAFVVGRLRRYGEAIRVQVERITDDRPHGSAAITILALEGRARLGEEYPVRDDGEGLLVAVGES